MIDSHGYAALSATSQLAPFTFQRREPAEDEILIDISYCGVCHSDIHQVRNEWGASLYPMVPGHEIVGVVAQVGSQVTKFKVGDIAGVGCMVDACRTCHSCTEDLEQFCDKGPVFTYSSREYLSQELTQGGYANNMVVREAFALTISPSLDLSRVAPLLCAGITTYSPLRHANVKAGQKVGVVGLGGLGHMGVKLAKAFGARVVLFTHSKHKVDDAIALGADEVVLSTDPAQMASHLRSFHFILDTISATHDLNAYLGLLKRDGIMTVVGIPNTPQAVALGALINPRRQLVGSLIGGIKETQEMLDFCAEHNILCDVELIDIKDINVAYERVLKSDVKYRFVIDMT